MKYVQIYAHIMDDSEISSIRYKKETGYWEVITFGDITEDNQTCLIIHQPVTVQRLINHLQELLDKEESDPIFEAPDDSHEQAEMAMVDRENDYWVANRS